MTYAQWFATATSQLKEHGFTHPDAHTTARLLLDWVTSTRHANLLRPETPLEPGQQEKLHEFLNAALARRPLAYILGEKEFYGRRFKCDERALIPRPETELLIEFAIQQVSGLGRPRIADLGTGTGCIATTVALEIPQAEVFATDLSPDALALAQENAEALNAKVLFVPGKLNDWAGPLANTGSFDLVLSNPPYIAADEIPDLQPEIYKFEPHLALDGGTDGLNPYRDMAVQCRDLVRPRGWYAAELGAGQWADVAAIFRSQGWHVEPPIQDLAGHKRVVVAQLTNSN